MKDQNRGGKPNFERGRKPEPERGGKSFEGRRRTEHRENKPFEGRRSAEHRDGKPFEGRRGTEQRDRKPFEGSRNIERRENKPFDGRGNVAHREGQPFRDRYGDRPIEKRGERVPHERFDRRAPGMGERPQKPEHRGMRPSVEDRPQKPEHRGMRPGADRRPPKPEFERREFRPRLNPFGALENPEMIRIVTARDAALVALRDVVRNGAYTSQALDRSLNAAELSPEDRRLAASIFFFAVENRLYMEWALAHFMQMKAEPLVEDVMIIASVQILFMDRVPDHAAVDEAVKQVRALGREGLTGLVNGVLRSLIRARDEGTLVLPDRENDSVHYLAVRYSFSEEIAARLLNAYGLDAAEAIAAYIPADRAQTVRPNRLRIGIPDFEQRLTENGYMWQKSIVPGAYRIPAAGDLSTTEDYRKGLFSIQGESSQLAALAMEAKPGMQVLDACAAPGGKTCLMAEMMNGVGRVYAWDLHDHRVELIRAAAKRLGLENVRPMTHDARRAPDSMLMSMDAVLVDAPCSGIGVIADKPDVKYHASAEEFEKLPKIQAQILDACAKCVRPGGRLVYSTCTILPEENQEQIRAFLHRNPEFEMDLSERWLPEALRANMQDGMLTILPNRDHMEGFFIARLIRRDV